MYTRKLIIPSACTSVRTRKYIDTEYLHSMDKQNMKLLGLPLKDEMASWEVKDCYDSTSDGIGWSSIDWLVIN